MSQFPTEETLDTVNELLPAASATGAYCLGAVCAFAWQEGIQPPKSILEMAVKCESVEKAVDIYATLKSLRDA